jgi:hypothetical protein
MNTITQLSLSAVAVMAMSIGGVTAANAAEPSNLLGEIKGNDGIVRTLTYTGAGVQVGLNAGDQLVLEPGGSELELVDAAGTVIADLEAPTVKTESGHISGVFTLTGDTFAVAPADRSACAASWLGSFIVGGVGGVVVCGAVGAATGGVGGAICGAGWAAATTGLNYDYACK